MIRIILDGVEKEFDEDQVIGFFSNVLISFTQLVEISITSYIFGFPLYDNKEIITSISKSLHLLDMIGPQAIDPILIKGIETISLRFHSVLSTDEELSSWLKEKYQLSGKELSAMRKRAKRPGWIDNPEYQTFMKKSIAEMIGALGVLERLLLRLREWRGNLGLSVENIQEEATFRKIQLLQNQRLF